ncbi:Gfo/Idh/MocA family protein [Aquisphaera insulae]|uniref:Gfo/Idh/MocA family protein n=1 Tax=Aquisphaera insulae TaxID=2712864 RepID=UPI0013EBBDFE|nr:Gfo/Idh/MocA family oxidoreductase [Aquisphaera insulae]
MPPLPGPNRRQFLARTAVAAVGFPTLIPATALGRGGLAAPSERIRVGLIGCGNHGVYWNLPQIFRCPDAQVVAVCDVDRNHLAEGRKAVDDHYGPLVGKGYIPCATTGDFRKLILRKDVDVVSNHTPDHWHVIPSIMAAKCGKDVICEKPLTLFHAEGVALCRAIADHRRIFQTASENRSIDVYIRLAELVRSGVLGKLERIEVGLPTGNNDLRLGPQYRAVFNDRVPAPVPPELDYQTWLGQAPDLPYIPARTHGSFRWNLAFSGGVLTDWGAHMIDLAQWAHDTEHTGAVSVAGRGDFPPFDAAFNTTPTFDLTYEYADGVVMTVRSEDAYIRFRGTNGWISSEGWRGALKASDPGILEARVDPARVNVYHPSEIVMAVDGNRGGEHRNFYDCVKSRKPTYAPAEIGHRTITIAHLGNIAMRLGRKLRWDPAAEDFVGDPAASAMLTRPQRSPWTIANIDRWI